jgi:hypothetical protein
VQGTLNRPDDATVKATYGYDPERGVWAELVYCDGRVVHDATEINFDFERPLLSILRFLASYAFVAPNDVDDACEWLAGKCRCVTFEAGDHGWPSCSRRAPRRGVLRIVENLRLAGG